MCPFCLATLGLVVAGAVSSGGLAALAVNVSRKKNPEAATIAHTHARSDAHGNTHSR
jgi:hypothetical protein